MRLPPAMKEWRRKQPQVKSAQVAQVVKLDKASLHRQEDRDKYTEAVGEFVGVTPLSIRMKHLRSFFVATNLHCRANADARSSLPPR